MSCQQTGQISLRPPSGLPGVLTFLSDYSVLYVSTSSGFMLSKPVILQCRPTGVRAGFSNPNLVSQILFAVLHCITCMGMGDHIASNTVFLQKAKHLRIKANSCHSTCQCSCLTVNGDKEKPLVGSSYDPSSGYLRRMFLGIAFHFFPEHC